MEKRQLSWQRGSGTKKDVFSSYGDDKAHKTTVPAMQHILFRVDASVTIGSGHVMRCRTLAREMRRRGANITFLCRRQRGDMIALLGREFTVLALPERPLSATQTSAGLPLAGRDLYSAWLGCRQEVDVADCLEALHQEDVKVPSWLVVDHYGLDAAWETQIIESLAGRTQPRLLAIDDLADRAHSADLLLDQNFFGDATTQRYRGRLTKHCRQLLGPQYALLGDEYSQLHPFAPIRTELARILVFFGGGDLHNLTSKALKALMIPELDNLAVDVVLGHQMQNNIEVEDLVSKRMHTTLHHNLPSLSALILRADLSIGAGGSTTWERMCLGLPSISFPIALNQIDSCMNLSKHLCSPWMNSDPHLEVADISRMILDCLRNPKILQQHSARAYSLCDGKGVSRVVDEIKRCTALFI
jgi:UDP-2,4-diacetamido-2,4,6-trideoxy-beta-L-altropyranose hydrolase